MSEGWVGSSTRMPSGGMADCREQMAVGTGEVSAVCDSFSAISAPGANRGSGSNGPPNGGRRDGSSALRTSHRPKVTPTTPHQQILNPSDRVLGSSSLLFGFFFVLDALFNSFNLRASSFPPHQCTIGLAQPVQVEDDIVNLRLDGCQASLAGLFLGVEHGAGPAQCGCVPVRHQSWEAEGVGRLVGPVAVALEVVGFAGEGCEGGARRHGL